MSNDPASLLRMSDSTPQFLVMPYKRMFGSQMSAHMIITRASQSFISASTSASRGVSGNRLDLVYVLTGPLVYANSFYVSYGLSPCNHTQLTFVLLASTPGTVYDITKRTSIRTFIPLNLLPAIPPVPHLLRRVRFILLLGIATRC